MRLYDYERVLRNGRVFLYTLVSIDGYRWRIDVGITRLKLT